MIFVSILGKFVKIGVVKMEYALEEYVIVILGFQVMIAPRLIVLLQNTTIRQIIPVEILVHRGLIRTSTQ